MSFDRFEGKVVLVVNTASRCGFTPQYDALEALYSKYEKDGLVILGFPCNQFGNQEPGVGAEIETACKINYGVTFPIFDKCDVKGPSAHPVFQWLTRQLPGWFGSNVKWNFTKFLVDRQGNPVARYAPITNPERIEPAIVALLKKT